MLRLVSIGLKFCKQRLKYGFKAQATRLLTTAASFCHKTNLLVSLPYGFWDGCKIYHLDCDLGGFVNWLKSKPPALVEQLEYMVDTVRFTPSSLRHFAIGWLWVPVHMLSVDDAEVCLRAGMKDRPMCNLITLNNFPIVFVLGIRTLPASTREGLALVCFLSVFFLSWLYISVLIVLVAGQ